MTILTILALLFGIFLVFDGAFNRGLLATVLQSGGETTVGAIRIAEVAAGGTVFLLLGFLLSAC